MIAATDRRPERVLGEAVGHLAFLATQRHYAEQPALWQLGERGRARTLEDYEHHFRRLGVLDADVWRGHLDYCDELWTARGFPRRWLADAFRIMGDVVRDELGSDVGADALELLRVARDRAS